MRSPPPNVAALLNELRAAGGSLLFDYLAGRLWSGMRISHEATQRALKRAEADGLVTVWKGNRARAETWIVRLAEVPDAR